MLNRTKEEAEQYIRENTGKMTTKEIAAALNVSAPRVSQMRGAMKGETLPANETALAPEAA